MRLIVLLFLLALTLEAAPLRAQESVAVEQAASASTTERPITYTEMLRTYRRLQPKTDSLNAGLIGAFQTGLVVDETLTRFGRDFYEAFYQQWTAPEGVVAYTLLIQEQPLPGLSTLITVRLDSEIVYQARLQPGDEYREAIVQEALQTAYRKLSLSE